MINSLIFLLFSFQFVKIYGISGLNEFVNSIVPTHDKGAMIAGSQGYDIFDILIVKFDSMGDFQWAKKIGNDLLNHEASYIISTMDSNFAVTGYIDNGIPFLSKFDSIGNFLWIKGIEINGYVNIYSLIECYDKGLLLAGNISGAGLNTDILLLKFDSTGNPEWGKLIDVGEEDGIYSLIETENREILFTGFTYNGVESDILLGKFDSLGNPIWIKRIGDAGNEGGYSIIALSNKGFIVSGTTTGFSSSSDIILIKMDSLGNLIWSRVIGESGDEHLTYKCLISTQDNGFAVLATTESFGETPDIFFAKFDSSGNLQYAKKFNLFIFYSFYDYGKALFQTTKGEYIIVGEIEDTTISSRPIHLTLIKLDSLGNTCQGDSSVLPFLSSITFQISNLSAQVTSLSYNVFSPSCSIYSENLSQTDICQTGINEFSKCITQQKIPSSIFLTKRTRLDLLLSLRFFLLSEMAFYNSCGILLFKEKKFYLIKKQIEKLPTGVYFLSLHFKNNKSKIIKLIKQE